jgi:hypothetical protein
MNFQAVVPSKKAIKIYLKVVNSLLDLTPRELDILELFLLVDLEWSDKRYKNIVDAYGRKEVMKRTFINKNNLSKCIRVFKSKNILVEHETGMWSINPSLLPSKVFEDKEINIEFIIKIEE